MERHGSEIHVTTDEARAGATYHVVRYVLVIGLLLAIAAMTLIWVTGALTSPQPNRQGPISGQATPRE